MIDWKSVRKITCAGFLGFHRWWLMKNGGWMQIRAYDVTLMSPAQQSHVAPKAGYSQNSRLYFRPMNIMHNIRNTLMNESAVKNERKEDDVTPIDSYRFIFALVSLIAVFLSSSFSRLLDRLRISDDYLWLQWTGTFFNSQPFSVTQGRLAIIS